MDSHDKFPTLKSAELNGYAIAASTVWCRLMAVKHGLIIFVDRRGLPARHDANTA